MINTPKYKLVTLVSLIFLYILKQLRYTVDVGKAQKINSPEIIIKKNCFIKI